MTGKNNMLQEQEALLRSIKKSHVILEGVIESPRNVVIFALDCQYRYLIFNHLHRQTMQQIWGVDIAFGACMLDYIKDKGDRAKAQKNFDRALLGESFMVEEQYGDLLQERRYYEDIYSPILDEKGEVMGLTLFLTDITERKRIEAERNTLINELQEALQRVKVLSGLLPVCAQCKKIRDENGIWESMEKYVQLHSELEFSHGLCPDCTAKLYPEYYKRAP